MNMRAMLAAILLLPSPAFADDSLQLRMQRVLDEQQLTGAAWALVLPGGATETGAAGLANAARSLPFSPRMRFHIGSVTKTLLATGVLRLASRGLVELDAPVARYLPGLAIDNPWRETQPVTVRHLLDHTAGLDDARLWQMFSADVEPDTPLVDAFSRPRDVLRIRSRPGTRLSYSNMGYTLLGLLVEAVSGKRYESYLDEHLLAPLGMRDSTFKFTTQQGADADPLLAWGHTDGGVPHAAIPVMLRPAAQFTTTAHDLAVFARFLMGDGRIDGETFIEAGLMRARGHASTTEAAQAGLRAGYALGLSLRDRYGAVGYCHSGNVVGFVALLCVYPQAGKAFAISVNTDSETADYARVFETLAAHLQLPPPEEAPRTAIAPDVQEWRGWYRLEPNRFEQFAGLDSLFANLKVEFDGEVMHLVAFPGSRRRLQASGGHLFTADDRQTPSHVLLRSDAGERVISDGYGSWTETTFLRIALRWLSFAAGLAGLLWFLGAGIVALLKHRAAAWTRVEIVPLFGVLALLAPLPLFLTQSFVELGDPTPASLLLALVTGLLPVTMLVTLWRLRTTPGGPLSIAHGVFAAAVLQWCVLLAAWEMLPLTLWR